MIKAITNVRKVSPKEFEALSRLFDALGFEAGHGWDEGQSKGAPWMAPQGSIEIYFGKDPATTDLVVEVTDLENAFRLAQKSKLKIAQPIKPTHWKSRLFILEPAKGLRIAFFEFDDPAKKWPQGKAGDLNATGMRFAIVVGRFNSFITERLLAGSLDALQRCGAHKTDIQIVRVAGGFEIPSAARMLAETGHYDGVICLGCIIRGETSHYQHLSDEVTRGIGQSAQETGVPHAYGVLTCDNLEQAIDRAGLKAGNKGFDAALSAVEMASLRKKIGAAKTDLRKSASKPVRERRRKLRFSDLERVVEKVTSRRKK